MGCGTIFQRTSQLKSEPMFGVPERRANGNNVYFYVPMAKPAPLGARLRMDKTLTILPDPVVQPKFKELQNKVLNELTKTETLFKNKPSFESLERITPQWGIIYDDTTVYDIILWYIFACIYIIIIELRFLFPISS